LLLLLDSQACLHHVRNSVRSDLIGDFERRSYMTLSYAFEMMKLLTLA